MEKMSEGLFASGEDIHLKLSPLPSSASCKVYLCQCQLQSLSLGHFLHYVSCKVYIPLEDDNECATIGFYWILVLIKVPHLTLFRDLQLINRFSLPDTGLCQRRLCGYRERCKVARDDKSVRKLCKCDYFRCDHKKNEVCGRDGHTYPSVCHLQRQECLSGHPIGIHHFNKCKENHSSCHLRSFYTIIDTSKLVHWKFYRIMGRFFTVGSSLLKILLYLYMTVYLSLHICAARNL